MSARSNVQRDRPLIVSTRQARAIWIAAQRLDESEPFGAGPGAVASAIAHLGYVQIDTINVIERCHHHILYNRIPRYRRTDLEHAQSDARTVFEYWTHALSYIHIDDFPFFAAGMKAHRKSEVGWGGHASLPQLRKMLRRIQDDGPLSIADIKDDRLVEKEHLWASRKPSKRVLQAGFYTGQLAIARRDGMLKTYELTGRHFGWQSAPKPASPSAILRYQLLRALRSQGMTSLESACYANAAAKPAMAGLIAREVRAGRLVPVTLEDDPKTPYWAKPESLAGAGERPALTHILSPFDPLIIQRKRTKALFGYEHIFEAYLAMEKRKFGYFTLPVLHGDEIIAALDLKADRAAGKLLIQAWHWVGRGNTQSHKRLVEAELHRFADFQFGS